MSNWYVMYDQAYLSYRASCRCGFDKWVRSAVQAYRWLNIHYRMDNCAYSPQNEQLNDPKSLPETEENGYNVSPFID